MGRLLSVYVARLILHNNDQTPTDDDVARLLLSSPMLLANVVTMLRGKAGLYLPPISTLDGCKLHEHYKKGPCPYKESSKGVDRVPRGDV
jgi:hypothetical protein